MTHPHRVAVAPGMVFHDPVSRRMFVIVEIKDRLYQDGTRHAYGYTIKMVDSCGELRSVALTNPSNMYLMYKPVL